MNNFEKFKADLTVEKLASLLEDACDEDNCQYCIYYDYITCTSNCEYGIKKYLEREEN